MKKIIVLSLLTLLLLSSVVFAGNGATVERVYDENGEKVGQRIYVPGKIPAGRAAVENPANQNPIEVAGF